MGIRVWTIMTTFIGVHLPPDGPIGATMPLKFAAHAEVAEIFLICCHTHQVCQEVLEAMVWKQQVLVAQQDSVEITTWTQERSVTMGMRLMVTDAVPRARLKVAAVCYV